MTDRRYPGVATIVKIFVAVACIAYPFVLHWGLSAGLPVWTRMTLSLLPFCLLAVFAISRARNHRFVWMLGAATFVGAIFVLEQRHHIGVAAATGLPHAMVYAFMAWIFGRTLLPGRLALITGFALRVHGEIPPYIERYSRQVTAAWCVFCLLQIALSVLLFAFAPRGWWFFFVNVMNLPLLGAMFFGEYAFRLWRFTDFAHASLRTSARVFSDSMAGRAGQPGK